jgi:heat shock protein HspQ
MIQIHTARFRIGQVVRHREDAFRGVVMDVDAGYDGPAGDVGSISPQQPFYRVFAMGAQGGFIAYAAEAVLEAVEDQLTTHDQRRWFTVDRQGHHAPRDMGLH